MAWVTEETIYRLTNFNSVMEWSLLMVKEKVFSECEMPFKCDWVTFTATKVPTASQITNVSPDWEIHLLHSWHFTSTFSPCEGANFLAKAEVNMQCS